MRNRRAILVIIVALGIAVAILSQMPPSLDNPTAYPELRYARPLPEQIVKFFPGELCDQLQATFNDLVAKNLSAPYVERAVWYDQVLQARSDLTSHGCTEP